MTRQWVQYNLFPMTVAKFSFGRELSEKEIAFVKGQDTYPNQGNLTSVDAHLLRNPDLKEILDFCNESLNEYLTQIHAPKNPLSLEMTQSWANYTEPGRFHHKHNHPNSFVSGVFYVSCDSNLDTICFYKSEYEQIKIFTENSNIFNADSCCFSIAVGDLFLFPSSALHAVPVVNAESTRISIAFNSFLKGDIGDGAGLKELRL